MNRFIDEHVFEEVLEHSGLISSQDLLFAKQESAVKNKPFVGVLFEEGLLTAEQIKRLTGMTSGISFVDLNTKRLDPDVLSIIPEPQSRQHKVICFEADDNSISVACVDLESVGHLEQQFPSVKIIPFLTSVDSFAHALKQYQNHLMNTYGSTLRSALGRMRNPESFKGLEEELPIEYHTEIAEDISTNKVIRTIIQQADMQGASHIYITPTGQETVISHRIDGVLREVMSVNHDALPGIIIALRHMIDRSIADKTIESGFVLFEYKGCSVRLQVLFFDTYAGKKVVIKFLRQEQVFDSLELLVPSISQQEYLYRTIATHPWIIVSGDIKSGVTRGYYSLLEYLAGRPGEIVSLENPIEAPLSGVTQIGTAQHKHPERLLRRVVASRPDVIGFSPFVMPRYIGMFATLKSGIKMITEVGPFKDFMTMLIRERLASKTMLASMKCVMVHQKFSQLQPGEQRSYTLSKKDMHVLKKYISEGELISFFEAEGVVPQGARSLRDISLSVRDKKIDKQDRAYAYIRGVADLSVLKDVEIEKTTDGVSFLDQARVLEKRAILENGLLRSVAGEVCFNELVDYLNT